jgi:hypothetical protein
MKIKFGKVTPPLPEYEYDGHRYRPSIIGWWVPPAWAWRGFLVGFAIMGSLIVSNVLVWQLLSTQVDKNTESLRINRVERCDIYQQNRQVIRNVINAITSEPNPTPERAAYFETLRARLIAEAPAVKCSDTGSIKYVK